MVRNIVNIVKEIVDSINKTLTKLFICDISFLQVGDVIVDDENRDATILTIGENFITVQKSEPFVWTSKTFTVVKNVYFFGGTPLRTNAEWLQFAKTIEAKTPFIWLVEPTNERFLDRGAGLERESDLRLYFLDKMQPHKLTIETQTTVIDYLRTWVDAFLLAIEKNKDFAELDGYDYKALTYFGIESRDGYTEQIIDSDLSAIELRLVLPIRKGAKCLC
jgi:hypothetical protein